MISSTSPPSPTITPVACAPLEGGAPGYRTSRQVALVGVILDTVVGDEGGVRAMTGMVWADIIPVGRKDKQKWRRHNLTLPPLIRSEPTIAWI